MASIIIGAGVLAYQTAQDKRKKKKAHNDTRFSELERDNAARIANLQQTSCFCNRSDWTGDCPMHGALPQVNRTQSGLPRYNSEGNPRRDTSHTTEASNVRPATSLQTEGWHRAPPSMDRTEIAKINEERRRKGQGYKRLFRRKA